MRVIETRINVTDEDRRTTSVDGTGVGCMNLNHVPLQARQVVIPGCRRIRRNQRAACIVDVFIG